MWIIYYRGHARTYLKDLEKIRPSSILGELVMNLSSVIYEHILNGLEMGNKSPSKCVYQNDCVWLQACHETRSRSSKRDNNWVLVD